MKLSLQDLWGALETLRAIHDPSIRIPVSLGLHLRRFEREARDEMDLARPIREEFQKTWNQAAIGEPIKFPAPGEPNFDEFIKAEKAIFHEDNCVVAFIPFRLDLLENSSEVIPGPIVDLMMDLNKEFERQVKENEEKEKEKVGNDPPNRGMIVLADKEK